MRNFLLFLAALTLAFPATAQNGPKFGKNGGVGAADSSVVTGEPTGGAFAIDGKTGVAALKGITLPAQTTIQPGQISVPKSGGTYISTPNYVGNEADAAIKSIVGSRLSPSTTAGAAGLFEKFSGAREFNALAGLAVKSSMVTFTRATGVYGEAFDPVGGADTFVEGGRFQGTLTGGAHGGAYGLICVGGTDISGVTNFAYLIGCEGEVDDQVGPNAPPFTSFDKNHFSASFVSTNGVGGSTMMRYDADVAFIVNPYSLGKFQTGLLVTKALIGTAVAATSGTALVSGIDLSLATFSSAAIRTPGFEVSPLGAVYAAGYSVQGTTGATCSPGTASLATLAITNGIVTHC